MKRLGTLLAAVALAAPCMAQEVGLTTHPRVQQALNLLEIWVDAQRAYEEIPGIAMGVIHDQELLWSKGFGYADPERQQPTTPQTIHSICSISKLFTAVAVMRLRDEGRLRLDDPVGTHLDWFDLQDKYPQAPPVTIQGILTHSAGLPRESDYPYWTPPEFPFPTHEQIVQRLGEQAELYPAYTYYQYSNLGLTLAGEVVAELSGQPYGEYIRHNILDPLSLESTYPEIPVEQHGRRMAVGYTAMTRAGTRERLPVFEPRGIAPAAGFASTVEDLAKFASWQFRVLHHGANEILARNTLREMYRVHWLDPDWDARRALGFGTWRSNDKTYVGHGGSCPGYRSHFNLQPDDKVAVVFMANANGVNTWRFTDRAQAIVAPAIRAARDTSSRAEPIDPALAKYAGTYSDLPWIGEVAVFPWKGSLAMLYLPTTTPLDDLMKLRHVDGHTFRRVRDDGSLGEEIVFQVDGSGQVTRLWRHSNYSPRVR